MNSVGIGTRVLSFMVDSFPVFLLTFVAYRGWSFYVFYYDILYIPFFYFWMAVTFLYYLLFEGIFNRTPGKWISLTKIADANGNKPSFGQICVRSIARVAGVILLDSLFLPFTGRTLHDYISKTYIIEV